MTFTPEIERELCELLWARCDGTIRPEQIERLDELVCTNEQCRKFYVLYMHLHAGLCWDRACTGLTDSLSRVAAGGGSPRIGGTPGFDPPPMPGRTKKSVDSSASGGSLFRLAPVWGGLALLAMLMIVGVFLREHSSAPLQRTLATADAPEFIAKVSGTNGCVWDVGPDRRLPVLGSHLHVGQRIRLKEGVAQITFHVGATLLLQGPATFDVESYTRAFLHSGKLTASVSHRARGFTIQTPSAKVIDLGTQFGVDAEAGGDTEVHVFRGVVELEPGSGESPASRQRLTGGQATRINAAGENLPGTQLAAGDFPMVLWEESQTTRQPGESALPGDKLAIDFEQSGGKLNSAQWYVSGDMNATRLRTRYPSQGTWLLSTDGAAGHPDAVLNVKESVIDGNTSIAWGPFFTVNDEVPEGAVISLDIAGGGFPWSENVVNGPAGVALWDVAARDFARGPSSNVVFVFSSVNRFLPKREEISLAGLEGKTLGIVVVDRRSINWGWVAVDRIRSTPGVLKVHHNPHHRVAVINDFDNLDALRGWKGDIDSFQLGRTGASDRAQAYIDGNVGEEGEFPAGRGYLSSNTARDGVASKGTIRSPAFTLRGDILEYYLTGTGGDGVALELVDTEADGREHVIASAVTSSAFFVHYYWPINPRWVGREVYLRLVDKSSRGYIEVDAIRMVEFDVNGNEK